MLNLRSHKECLAAGSQPVVGTLCAQGKSQRWSAVAGGYAPVRSNDGTSDQPAIRFPMNPEVGI